MSKVLPCPVCGATAYADILTLERMPVIGCQFATSVEEAHQAECGVLALAACRECGHVFNRAFDIDRVAYVPGYENALNFSPRHRDYMERVADSLIERYGLRHKTIVEVGCGRAEFLERICRGGGNHGIGYDPSQADRELIFPRGGSLRVIGAPFGDSCAGADAVFFQYVLEHLAMPGGLLREARRHLVADGLAYVEVPHSGAIFTQKIFWDLTYEHVSYFSPATLRRLLAEAGFTVANLADAFGHQYLAAEAIARPMSIPAERDCNSVDLCDAMTDAIEYWRDLIAHQNSTRRRVVLWGAGTKAVSFLNMTGIHPGEGIDYVVDINSHKHGRYIPGTGQRIVAPSFLRDYGPDIIVMMNGEYRSEIAAQLNGLDLRTLLLESTTTASAA